MTTIKLKKPKPTAPGADARAPLRPSGIKRLHPTLAQAQAERAERRRTPWEERPPEAEPPARGPRPAPTDPRRRSAPSGPLGSTGRGDRRDGPAPERRPGPAADRRPGPGMERRPGPGMDRWPGPGMERRPGPGPDRRPAFGDDRRPGPSAPSEPRTQQRPPRSDSARDRPRPEERAQPAWKDRVRAAAAPASFDAHRSRAVPPPAPVATADATPRLSKRMSELGLASRREADDWIERGLVRVDGVIVDQLGARVSLTQKIEVDPEAHNEQSQRVTILLHKPLGIVSGQAEDGHAPAATLVNAASRWPGDMHPLQFHPSQLHHLVPAGRLDLDSTGLLVLTQDGRVAKQLIGADTKVEKEYVVHVAWPDQPPDTQLKEVFPADQLELLRNGLLLDKQALKPAKVSWQNETHLRFVLREGKRRQIRRMCEAVGLQVLGLKRIRIGRIGLGEMAPGQWRYLGPFETFL